jgi:molybdopterin synthase catalytic subunit
MRVRVRLFAVQRELAGTREVALELADGSTIEAAWSALVDRFPSLAPGRPAVRFARNGDYAAGTDVLADGDELAHPPVSGGAPADEGGPYDVLASAGGTAAGAASPDGVAIRIVELREPPSGRPSSAS